MTLEEAIQFHTEEARKLELHPEINKLILGIEGYERAKEEHTQTAEWLKELAERRKQPIIFCKDCEKHNKRFDEYPADEACPLTVWRVAQEHEFDYQFCAYAERRTDG